MKHFGDITKLNGAELPVVDVITGGSPCQDLSVAGKREGLDGERSGLFLEQIRIVKEMRENDRANGRTGFMVRPRYMVWENVPGAFSSNKGADFQTVLTEIVRIAEPVAPLCLCLQKSGARADASTMSWGGWSVAWRVHDAQFWGATQYVDGRVWHRGTPQRRKRIALVADFGGLTAAEILFVKKGLHGDFAEIREEGQGTSTDIERSIGESDK